MLDIVKETITSKVFSQCSIQWFCLYLVWCSLGLSKWVRHRVQHESNFKQSMASLRVFTEHMMRSDTETNMKDSKSIRSFNKYSE